MKRHSITLAIIAAILVGGAFWSWRFIRPLVPAFGPRAPIPSDEPSGPLTAAPGWSVSLLTDQVPGARDIVLDDIGNLWVSQPSQGTISLIELRGDTPAAYPVFQGLSRPHGLLFDEQNPYLLYIATETALFRVPTYSDGPLEKIADLPDGGRHFTRSLSFGPDGRLYVSIGSTCDVCREENPEHGSIISMRPDGSNRRIEATGLRNAVFMTNHPTTGAIWATEMGRDHLGDDLPPDEINIIRSGADYGWPICYGNRVHDAEFDTNVYIRNPCTDTVPPEIALPAHVAPLGLDFLDTETLLVAYHGSWNSSVPVGYQVVQWQRSDGVWTSSDFLTGFLPGTAALGRPVDVLVTAGGKIVYVSDDKAGAIWKMTRQ